MSDADVAGMAFADVGAADVGAAGVGDCGGGVDVEGTARGATGVTVVIGTSGCTGDRSGADAGSDSPQANARIMKANDAETKSQIFTLVTPVVKPVNVNNGQDG